MSNCPVEIVESLVRFGCPLGSFWELKAEYASLTEAAQ